MTLPDRRGRTYGATATRPRGAERFWLKPTALNSLHALRPRGAADVEDGAGRDGPGDPRASAEWFAIKLLRPRGFSLGRAVRALGKRGRALRFRKLGTVLRLVSARAARPYPEAGPGATGRPFRGTNPDGTVFGFVDTHLHITANLRAGGRVIHGEPFDRFGITEALGHDADDHGADGSLDVTGNLLRDRPPVRHPRHPWLADASPAGRPTTPTPISRSTTSWLQRAWMSGCGSSSPRRSRTSRSAGSSRCARTPATRRTRSARDRTQLRDLQDYVDAQSGGRGRGWFRIV